VSALCGPIRATRGREASCVDVGIGVRSGARDPEPLLYVE
jgi:hypothetical protein